MMHVMPRAPSAPGVPEMAKAGAQVSGLFACPALAGASQISNGGSFFSTSSFFSVTYFGMPFSSYGG